MGSVVKTLKPTRGPDGELSPAKQRDPLGWPFGALFQEDMKHQRQLQAARDKRAARKAAVDPAVEPARSLLADLAKWESPASPFLGNPDDLPGNPNEYGDQG
jgi:hypothetical protein